MNWKALTKTAKRTLSRNSSKILLGLGIAGAFTAVPDQRYHGHRGTGELVEEQLVYQGGH